MVNKLVFENLRFRPVRTALSVLAIGIEVAMMLTIVGLSEGMIAESQERARNVGADIWIRPRGSSVISASTSPIPEKMVQEVEKQPHVAMAVGAAVHTISGFTTMTGLDVNRYTKMTGGFRFESGGPPSGPDDILVDTYYAQQNNLSVGSYVTLINHRWRVSGIIQGQLARLVVPIKTLQELTTSGLSQIFVKVDNPALTNSVVADLRSKLPGYPIYSTEEFVSLISVNNVPMLRQFIWVIVGLSVVVGFLVVFLSMYTAVLERTREIGVLKALGASPPFVLGILIRETIVLAIVGTIIGIALSYGTRWLIAVFPTSLSQHVVPSWWPISGGIALIGALLGSAYPGWRASRQDPIEALSYE